MSLTIVGTVAYDEIITPHGESGRIYGGSATYASLAASQFALDRIDIISIVGKDFDQAYRQMFENRSINTSGIEQLQEGQCFFWKGSYHQDMNGRDTLETQLNVLEHFSPKLTKEARNAEFLMLGNLTPAVQNKVLDQMEKRPKLVIMDTMNFWMDIAIDELKTVLKRIDLLTINDEEARQLSGERSLVGAAQKIFTMGPQNLIIKKGEHGALLFSKEEMFFAPAMPLEEVFDPTGAGDVFAGGFIGFLAQNGDLSFANLKRAVVYGSALASFNVEKFGVDRIREVGPADLQNRLSQFKRLSQVDLS